MSYFFTTTLKNTDFDTVLEKLAEQLKEHGFGIMTEIDVKATLKKKIDVDFRPYKILGACNPVLAHKVLSAEAHIGVFLPCNVVVQENENGDIEVSAVDPVASMQSVENDSLGEIATDVQARMKRFIEELN
jgi:uncharacterized protein (DUF302 family)